MPFDQLRRLLTLALLPAPQLSVPAVLARDGSGDGTAAPEILTG